MSKPKKKTTTDNRLTYFLLSRSIFDSPIWCDDPHALKIFIYLLGTARHSNKPKRYPGFEIKRGELVTSLTLISENNSFMKNGVLKALSKQKVMRILNLLEKQGYIKRISDTYGTHVSICNYGIYQDPDTYKSDASGTVVEQEWNGTGTGVETNNNDNNVKNVNNDNKKEKINKKEFDYSEFSENMQDALKDWLEYKKYKYAAVGWKSFKTTLKKNIDKYSEETMIDCIINSIANQWKGVTITDKDKSKGSMGGTSNYMSEEYYTPTVVLPPPEDCV